MTSKYEKNAEFYLNIINEHFGIKLRLGGSDGRDRLVDSESGQDIGHDFPNMSQMYSCIYTISCVMGLREHNDKQHLQHVETLAHYWEKWGKELHEKDEAKKRRAFEKMEEKRKARK